MHTELSTLRPPASFPDSLFQVPPVHHSATYREVVDGERGPRRLRLLGHERAEDERARDPVEDDGRHHPVGALPAELAQHPGRHRREEERPDSYRENAFAMIQGHGTEQV